MNVVVKVALDRLLTAGVIRPNFSHAAFLVALDRLASWREMEMSVAKVYQAQWLLSLQPGVYVTRAVGTLSPFWNHSSQSYVPTSSIGVEQILKMDMRIWTSISYDRGQHTWSAYLVKDLASRTASNLSFLNAIQLQNPACRLGMWMQNFWRVKESFSFLFV